MPPLFTSVFPVALLPNRPVVHYHDKIFECNLKRLHCQTHFPLFFPSNNLDKFLNCASISFLVGICKYQNTWSLQICIIYSRLLCVLIKDWTRRQRNHRARHGFFMVQRVQRWWNEGLYLAILLRNINQNDQHMSSFNA